MMERIKVSDVWGEMARRKVQFHNDTPWRDICLWGLFRWSDVSHLLRRGLLLTDMKEENSTIWVQPSEEAYYKHIEPLLEKHTLEELKQLAGW